MMCAVCAARFTLTVNKLGCMACPENCNRCYVDAADNLVKCFDQHCETGFALRTTDNAYDCQGIAYNMYMHIQVYVYMYACMYVCVCI